MAENQRNSYLPALAWVSDYNRQALTGDALAGVIVAIMLVPQGMAYALLAGLPPQVGLYASILPLLIYGLLGSSRTLAVGPVAIVSLMVTSTLGSMHESGSDAYLAGAILLAFMSGSLLLAMGIARLGFLVDFLSHPVISGFTSAAALVIGFSQLKHLLGIEIPRSHLFTDTIMHAVTQLDKINPITISIAVFSFALLVYWKSYLPKHLKQRGFAATIVDPISKAGPLVVVLLTTTLVGMLALDTNANVKVVASIPAGLPTLTKPVFNFSIIIELLPAALLISLVGFLESVSVAKSLASKRRQKIDANQELIAIGAESLIVTFVAVLLLGFEIGIVIGAGLSIALYLWRTSRPHVAIVGRVGNTEHYRNVLRHEV